MSTASLQRRPRLIGPRKTVAIVASMYNETFVNGLLEATKNELVELMPNASVPLYRVPGAFEVPVCVKYLMKNSEVDVIIALGVLIRGETDHADLVASSVTDSLQQMAVESLTPLIHEILMVDNEEQAEQRCLGEEDYNRGTEAARAATHMVELFAKLKTTHPDGPKKIG